MFKNALIYKLVHFLLWHSGFRRQLSALITFWTIIFILPCHRELTVMDLRHFFFFSFFSPLFFSNQKLGRPQGRRKKKSKDLLYTIKLSRNVLFLEKKLCICWAFETNCELLKLRSLGLNTRPGAIPVGSASEAAAEWPRPALRHLLRELRAVAQTPGLFPPPYRGEEHVGPTHLTRLV